MQYTVHHACGHDETVVLYGPTKDRERRIAAMEAEDCPSCRAAEAHMDGCVDLVGSDKQVAWAGQIRRSFLPAWERDLQTAEKNLDEQLPKVQAQGSDRGNAGRGTGCQGTGAAEKHGARFGGPVPCLCRGTTQGSLCFLVDREPALCRKGRTRPLPDGLFPFERQEPGRAYDARRAKKGRGASP